MAYIPRKIKPPQWTDVLPTRPAGRIRLQARPARTPAPKQTPAAVAPAAPAPAAPPQGMTVNRDWGGGWGSWGGGGAGVSNTYTPPPSEYPTGTEISNPSYGAGDWGTLGRYTLGHYGYPTLDAMMQMIGFERVQDAAGKFFWRAKKGFEEYDTGAVNKAVAQTRDVLEPELLSQIAGGEANLANRGLERSSLMAGTESGLRGQYLRALVQKRLDMITEEKKRRWAQLMAILGGSSEMARATINPNADQGEGDFLSTLFGLGETAAGLGWQPFAAGA